MKRWSGPAWYWSTGGRLLRAEAAARQAGRGHWGRGGGFRLFDAVPYDGPVHAFALVEGHVLKVSERRSFVYLNFQEDWRRDFTIGVRRTDLEAFKAAGIDVMDLAGRKLQVRGWVGWYYGPFLKLQRPGQLFLPDGAARLGAVSPPR